MSLVISLPARTGGEGGRGEEEGGGGGRRRGRFGGEGEWLGRTRVCYDLGRRLSNRRERRGGGEGG